MHDYSVAVALFDFVPVAVSAAGLIVLAAAIARRHGALAPVAWAAALAIPLGGACKATWKLLIALGQPDVPWLANLLFILLAPGFAAMAFALHHARRAARPAVSPARLAAWLAASLLPALALAIALPGSRAWFFWLLGATVAGSAARAGQAVVTARALASGWPVTAAFAYNFAATFALGGLARLPAGEATAWIQESVNLSAQAAFAWGAWRLAQGLSNRSST
jgi:hypothetical protein